MTRLTCLEAGSDGGDVESGLVGVDEAVFWARNRVVNGHLAEIGRAWSRWPWARMALRET